MRGWKGLAQARGRNKEERSFKPLGGQLGFGGRRSYENETKQSRKILLKKKPLGRRSESSLKYLRAGSEKRISKTDPEEWQLPRNEESCRPGGRGFFP